MKWAIFALQMLPHVLTAVTAVEGAIGAGEGKAKKQIVLDAIQAGAKVAGGVPEDHVAAVGTLIDSVVKNLNESGILDGKPRKVGK